MTNIIHSASWEGPCRWEETAPAEDKQRAEETFPHWPRQMRGGRLGRAAGVRILEPVHLTFREDFTLREADLARLDPDMAGADVIYLAPGGAGLPGCQVALRYKKPVLLLNLGCRNVCISGLPRSKGCEVHVAADDAELAELVTLLRARAASRPRGSGGRPGSSWRRRPARPFRRRPARRRSRRRP